jgi:hypothetical protein
MHVAEHDPDLFVQKAAVEALVTLKDLRSASLLCAISGSSNRFLAISAKRGLQRMKSP